MFQYSRTLSELLADKCNKIIAPNECYSNVYRIVTQNILDSQAQSIEILFCYRQGEDGRYYRHVFIMADGMLVEPLLDLDMSESNLAKIVVIKQLKLSEYLAHNGNDDHNDLRKYLYEFEINAIKHNDILDLIGGFDLAKLYRKLAEKPQNNTLLDILKNNLPDGVKLTDERETASRFKFTLSFDGVSINGEIEKTVSPGYERSFVSRVIATCMGKISLQKGDIESCKRWLECSQKGTLK